MPLTVRSEMTPRGDQAQAIEKLVNGLKLGLPHQILLGVTGSGKTYTMFGGEWALNDKSSDYEQRKNFNMH